MTQSFLYYGDNLDILRNYIENETVDLIYLDPPFKSNQDYNVLFQERNGSQSKAQIKVFEDTWQWDQEAAAAFQEIVEKGPEKVSKVMQAFRMFLGDNDMLAYLSMMAPRLVELQRVLKPTGSIYLHCDPTASHYLKLLMDAAFGTVNFRREIIWTMSAAAGYKALVQNFVRGHDTLLYYSRSKDRIFNKYFKPYSKEQLARFSPVDEHGRHYKPITKTRRLYLDEAKGVPLTDVWSDIANFQTVVNAKESLGYPTQKPEALLERIIKASSNEGDVVLDPFCGCGTAISAAQKLNRRWIGIDITHLAIGLIKHRLQDTFGRGINSSYEVIGEPTDLTGAGILAKEDPYQFQWWALGLVGARPIEQKKGADRGIDGRIYFHDEPKKTKQIILQVKAGHITSAHIRDLRGVLDREKAEIGVFITFRKPSKAMRREAAGADFYHSPGWDKQYPRLQILTIEELLSGKAIDYPAPGSTSVTFKKAPRFKGKPPEQKELFNN